MPQEGAIHYITLFELRRGRPPLRFSDELMSHSIPFGHGLAAMDEDL
jgi:hypothetical protein